MPFLSEKEMLKVQSVVSGAKTKAARARAKAEEKAGAVKSTLECAGAAAAIGYLRGMREQPDGTWNAPFIKFDMEALTGISLVGMSYFELFGRYDEDVLNMGNGVLAHYTGQIMRKMAKTGTFSMVAGDEALPSYDGDYSGYNDEVAAAVAMSEL